MNIGVIGNTILTSSGVYFDFKNPSLEQIRIADIAKALSNSCRFGGHCEFYSVAEHSVHVAELARLNGCDLNVQFEALLHDASEAYTGDMPKPLKVMLPDFNEVEDRIETLIRDKFSLPFEKSPVIKRFDLQMLKCEKLFLFPGNKDEWSGMDEVDEVKLLIQMWQPNMARKMFNQRFEELVGLLGMVAPLFP